MDRELADNGFVATGRAATKTLCLLKKLACLHLEGSSAKFVAALESGELSLRSGIAALELARIFRQATWVVPPDHSRKATPSALFVGTLKVKPQASIAIRRSQAAAQRLAHITQQALGLYLDQDSTLERLH